MLRRILTLAVIVSIAFAGSAPAFAMPMAMDAPGAGMSAAADNPAQPAAEAVDGDCMKAMEQAKAPAADDCCGKSDHPDKSKCAFDESCAARCHVNAAIELTPYFIIGREPRPVALRLTPPPLTHAERPGPLYRPPII